MNTQAELEADIRGLGITVIDGPPVDLTEPLAAHLMAAGYRKPRTVTTVEELDALPVGSAVRSAMGSFYVKDQDMGNPSDTWWSAAGSAAEFLTSRVSLPAAVLHEGEAEKITPLWEAMDCPDVTKDGFYADFKEPTA